MTTSAYLDRDQEAVLAAQLLDNHPDYRVLRRFEPRSHYTLAPIDLDDELLLGRPATKRGLYVDVETTGLDTERDQIIELALVPFEFDARGRVFDVGSGTTFFEDPGVARERRYQQRGGTPSSEVHA